MKIITYAASLADEAPDRFRCAARILLSDGSMHPVVFHAPDKPTARAKAEMWWAEQLEAERRKQENRQRIASRRKVA